ncbi:hypothetical protein OG226_21575 [Streptomyces sp. NBC_01261]|uniref:hypothetical protein n=1 Tax=Streptomyces sp. NBC_01261 TaxID=2903802 RepID=UPI002E35A76D|nr:hypothetical protein [Streptomyces sp. NBC_01261]
MDREDAAHRDERGPQVGDGGGPGDAARARARPGRDRDLEQRQRRTGGGRCGGHGGRGALDGLDGGLAAAGAVGLVVVDTQDDQVDAAVLGVPGGERHRDVLVEGDRTGALDDGPAGVDDGRHRARRAGHPQAADPVPPVVGARQDARASPQRAGRGGGAEGGVAGVRPRLAVRGQPPATNRHDTDSYVPWIDSTSPAAQT